MFPPPEADDSSCPLDCDSVAVTRRRSSAGPRKVSRGVSGYFHDWATWTLGSGGEADTGTRTLAEEEEGVGEVGEVGEEELWSTWDKILVKWNSGVLTKNADAKVKLG